MKTLISLRFGCAARINICMCGRLFGFNECKSDDCEHLIKLTSLITIRYPLNAYNMHYILALAVCVYGALKYVLREYKFRFDWIEK